MSDPGDRQFNQNGGSLGPFCQWCGKHEYSGESPEEMGPTHPIMLATNGDKEQLDLYRELMTANIMSHIPESMKQAWREGRELYSLTKEVDGRPDTWWAKFGPPRFAAEPPGEFNFSFEHRDISGE